ncbi:uncharacterized protein [Cicer arietinum]|uniref:Uncharacterized protein LOC101512952 n=1 Tax=Cicer arietinum TaxID=3827 RepID=A0A1S2Y8I6_CICAR|nr:uncharacterized protein LOC101512952 [Cicer arietinum]XP_004500533.1 uncharacterized protein LOC101512952 [Cicer arietinum]
MGKSVESVIRLKELSRVVSSSAKSNRPKTTQPISPNRVTTPRTAKQDRTVKVEPPKKIEALESRTPLARVVAYCSKRWFQDTLKGAKAGDSSMQVLVGQMYNSGYGVPRDPQKGHAWISRASRSRNLVWKVSEKQPGYRASDSDSCELENKSTP